MKKEGVFSDEISDLIRKDFYYVDYSSNGIKRIFLDSVSGSLRLKKMVDAVSKEAASYAQVSRSDPASKLLKELEEKFKEDVNLLLGAKSGHILKAQSGTHAMYCLVDAVLSNTKKGSNVVTSNLEHPAVYESTWYFSKKYNIERRVATFDKNSGRVKNEDILNLVDKNTCLLIMIHASNVTGAINNIEYIIKEARKINPGIYLIIDGIQYAPYGLIDVDRINADAYVISGYKLFCKRNTGFAHMSERLAKLPHWNLREKPLTNWSLGSEDKTTYAGFSAVVDYIGWFGSKFTNSKDKRNKITTAMDKIRSHNIGLLDLALNGDERVKGLKDMAHISLHGIDEDINTRAGILSFRVKNQDSTEIAVKYFKEGGISVSTRIKNVYGRHILDVLNVDDLVRISVYPYNTPKEILKFLNFTESLS